MLAQMSAVLSSWVLAPEPGMKPEDEIKFLVEEQGLLLPLLGKPAKTEVSNILARVARSPQLAVKAAGTHLTKETGKNKIFSVGSIRHGPRTRRLHRQRAVCDHG